MNTALFNRRWALTLVPPEASTGNKYTSLRVAFDIDKRAEGTSNKAKFQIYNFNPESRKQYKAGYRLRFEAGYGLNPEDALMSTIFFGDIPASPEGSISKRQGLDIITTFECGENEAALAETIYTFSYPPGTFLATIIEDLAAALGVPLGNVKGLTNTKYSSGYSFDGSVQKYLDDIARSQGLIWTIQNGALQIYPLVRSFQNQAIVLSSGAGFVPAPIAINSQTRDLAKRNTGLIGIPSTGDKFCVFEALLNPNIVPGCLVQIISEQVFGFFTVTRAHYQGDTHGDKWQVACEAVQVNAAPLPQQSLGGKINP